VGIVGLSVVGAAGQEGRQRATWSQSVEKPDYNRVFAMDRVHELRITIPAERFDEMQRDLARIAGSGPAWPSFDASWTRTVAVSTSPVLPKVGRACARCGRVRLGRLRGQTKHREPGGMS